ncbi:MAG: alpha/beta fold hydrolase [Ignavibacteriales bacterium]|nr:alpha/beta fold hydrolase [Ignavibacteriales bacterium]
MESSINSLKVFTSGHKENPSIIFIHGFPFDHSMWNNQVEELKDKYFCVTYDVRGLGASPAGDGQYTLESFVDDLESIIQMLKLNSPVLCGLSMGGYISLRALERIPNKFKAAILCDTRSESDTNEGKLKRAAAIKLINTNGVKEFASGFVPNCFSENFMKHNSDIYLAIVERSMASNPIAVKGCLLAMSGRTDTSSSLSTLKIPVLVLCGDDDKLTPPSVMKSMADKIPASKFSIVPNAGHMSPVENPDFVNKQINSFLASII